MRSVASLIASAPSTRSTSTNARGSRRRRRRRTTVTCQARKRGSKGSDTSPKYVRQTTDAKDSASMAAPLAPGWSLGDALAERDAEEKKSSGGSWMDALASVRDANAAKDRKRAEMGAELAEMEREEEMEDDLIDTTWVTEAGSIAKRQFRGLKDGETELDAGEDAEFIAFGSDGEGYDEDVWGPDDEIIEDFEDFDDDMDIFEPGGREVRPRGIPREMRCFDTAKIFIKAGDGGDGAVAFRREKFVPQGGPSGGNGGIGGSVYIVADKNMTSLDGFRKKVHHRAEAGKRGVGSKCAGRNGNDYEIHVPPGTIIRDSRSKKILAEVTTADQRVLLLSGGRGGRGNASFKTAKNKAPMIAELGEQGAEFWAEMELKLVADVGIIGIPNAGKSTLLASVSAAKPKIADYPFTTIVPNLGVVERDYERMVFADIPGLLEGASEGIGLGFEFLRHTKRTRVLIHVIDCASEDCFNAYDAIRTELELFDDALVAKPEIVALNKVDDIEATERALQMKEKFDVTGIKSHCISAVTGEGVDELLSDVQAALRALPAVVDEWESEVADTGLRAADGKSIQDFTITDTPYAFVVEGEAIERFTQMTNWDYFESYKRFGRVLEMSGVDAALNAAGAGEGDRVMIGNFEFEWSKDKRDRVLYETFRQRVADAPGAPRGSRHWPHAA